jgi:hypothetical protein
MMTRFWLFIWCCFPVLLAGQNDLQVLGSTSFTPEALSDGAEVTYLIRFQNISHDTVRHLLVRDTLDPRLDPTSIHVTGASHSYQLLHEGSSVIRWYFNYIRLPNNKINYAASSGFIVFKVRPKTFIAPGEIIRNRACTHFDTLYSICTNDAFIWIDSDAQAEDLSENTYRGYRVVPNPNTGTFSIQSSRENQPDFMENQPVSSWVTDVNGNRIWYAEGQKIGPIHVENPTPGVYMLSVKAANKTYTSRFIIQE